MDEEHETLNENKYKIKLSEFEKQKAKFIYEHFTAYVLLQRYTIILLGFLVCVGVILTYLKLFGNIDLDWWIVTLPFYCAFVAPLLSFIFILGLMLALAFSLIAICIIAFIILLPLLIYLHYIEKH